MVKRLKEIVPKKRLFTSSYPPPELKAGIIPEPIEFRGGNRKYVSRNSGVAPFAINFRDGRRGQNIKEENDEKSFHDWLNQKSNTHIEPGTNGADNAHNVSDELIKSSPNLNDHETYAIKYYSAGSGPLNQELLDHHNGKIDKISSKHEELARHIHTATSHPIGHELDTYSGLGFDPRNHVGTSGHLYSPCPISTSNSKSVAHGFTSSSISGTDIKPKERHILHVHLQPHDHALHIEHLTYNPGEYETMIPPKTTLHIHHTPTILHHKNGDKIHIWHATIAHQQ